MRIGGSCGVSGAASTGNVYLSGIVGFQEARDGFELSELPDEIRGEDVGGIFDGVA